MSKLASESIIRKSGFPIRSDRSIPTLSQSNIQVLEETIGGDAPKAFIRVYEYKPGRVRKDIPKRWPLYIAKIGHKWYPNESVTEHLMTRIGQILGFNLAFSKLRKIDNQVRFLSRYFLKDNEQLVHGAQIFGGYLEDKEFVQEVRDTKRSKDIFDFGFVVRAIRSAYGKYPDACEKICIDYVKMIGFDALVGNNDRHHANWGVIEHVTGERSPRFSPIYDTARGLFWNHPERTIRSKCADASKREAYISSYVDGATPMTGWENSSALNHFDLLRKLVSNFSEYKSVLSNHYHPNALQEIRSLMDEEFEKLMSDTRKQLILDCLKQRFARFEQII